MESTRAEELQELLAKERKLIDYTRRGSVGNTGKGFPKTDKELRQERLAGNQRTYDLLAYGIVTLIVFLAVFSVYFIVIKVK